MIVMLKDLKSTNSDSLTKIIYFYFFCMFFLSENHGWLLIIIKVKANNVTLKIEKLMLIHTFRSILILIVYNLIVRFNVVVVYKNLVVVVYYFSISVINMREIVKIMIR